MFILLSQKVKSYKHKKCIKNQVFLQDKKQILRLHNPLPNRTIASRDESVSSSLPPLDYTSRPQIGSIAAQVHDI
jgi:hypothetical protein